MSTAQAIGWGELAYEHAGTVSAGKTLDAEMVPTPRLPKGLPPRPQHPHIDPPLPQPLKFAAPPE